MNTYNLIREAFEAGWKVNALKPEHYEHLTAEEGQRYLDGCMDVDFYYFMANSSLCSPFFDMPQEEKDALRSKAAAQKVLAEVNMLTSPVATAIATATVSADEAVTDPKTATVSAGSASAAYLNNDDLVSSVGGAASDWNARVPPSSVATYVSDSAKDTAERVSDENHAESASAASAYDGDTPIAAHSPACSAEEHPTFKIPDDAKPCARWVHATLREHMSTMKEHLKNAGIPEREARSYIANSVVQSAWGMVSRERLMQGELPDPERFLSMVQSHAR